MLSSAIHTGMKLHIAGTAEKIRVLEVVFFLSSFNQYILTPEDSGNGKPSNRIETSDAHTKFDTIYYLQLTKSHLMRHKN